MAETEEWLKLRGRSIRIGALVGMRDPIGYSIGSSPLAEKGDLLKAFWWDREFPGRYRRREGESGVESLCADLEIFTVTPVGFT